MAITKEKLDIAALVASFGVKSKIVENLLNKIHVPEDAVNLNESAVLELFAKQYPFCADIMTDALYRIGLLKKSYGSGHAGSSIEIITVDWDLWRAAYPAKQQP